MGYEVTLDWNKLDTASTEVDSLRTALNTLCGLVKQVQENLDKRIVEEHQDYFDSLNSDASILTNDADNLVSFKSWLDNEITEAKITDEDNIESEDDLPTEPEGDSDVDEEAPGAAEEPEELAEEPIDTDVDEPSSGYEEMPIEELDDGSGGLGGGAGEVAGIAAGVGEAASELVDDLTEEEYIEPEHRYIGPVNSALEKYTVTKDAYEELTDDEKETIEEKMRLVGFTESEIDDLKDGKMSLPKVVMSDVANALEETIQNNPDLRDKIIDRYGFDIFYEDGTVNPTKLAAALLIDGKNPNDGYDLINMLVNDYGVDVVGVGSMSQFAAQLNNALELNPELRNQLVQKYGLEIFNPDGTINEDKLRYALMIDGFDSLDDFDMIGTIYNTYGININSLGSIDTLSMKLMEAYNQNPMLRQQLIDKFGFDIFNSDGTVNMDRLKYALMIDAFDKDDKLDFLRILYGTDTLGDVGVETLDNLATQLVSSLELDPEIRGRLIDMYGFDIFNEDGTVNLERLKYALMIDGFDLEDDNDLSKYLTEFLAQFVTEAEPEVTKKKGNPLPIIAGIGLAAGAAGTGYAVYKKKKEEEEESDEDKLYEDEDSDFDDEIDI